MRPTMPCFPTAVWTKPSSWRASSTVMDRLIVDARSRPRGGGLQHRLDDRAADAARALRRAVRRDRAGDQAGLRGLRDQARLRARHRGDREARIHPGADPRIRGRLRGDAGRLAATSPRWRSVTLRGELVADEAIAGGDRALLRRQRRRPHRHGRARLHAFSAADRAPASGSPRGRCASSIRPRRSPGGWST